MTRSQTYKNLGEKLGQGSPDLEISSTCLKNFTKACVAASEETVRQEDRQIHRQYPSHIDHGNHSKELGLSSGRSVSLLDNVK